MRMLVQLVVHTAIVLAVSGCLVANEKRSDAKNQGNTGSNNASSFVDRCEGLLKKIEDRTPHNDINHLIYRSYEVKEQPCIKLIVGSYEDKARAEMRRQPIAPGSHFQHSAGNFDAALRFMDRTGITCAYEDEQFELIFPTRTDEKIAIKASCRKGGEGVSINVGLDTENGEKLAITIYDRDERTNYAIDTNRFGQIIKQVKEDGQ